MFMKLSDIYEAQYSGHERGSLHWILDKFFEGPNNDNEYWIKENEFIALYKGKEIIGVQIDKQTDEVVLIPNLGGRASAFYSGTNVAGTAKYLHIYSSKRMV